jgi:uncharacterized protein (DUF1800 family)
MSTPAGDNTLKRRHLMRRAGFGPTRTDEEFNPGRAVTDVVDGLLTQLPSPDGAPAQAVDPSLDEGQRITELRWWWLDRMASDDAPLVEKMTLFWHGHFCSANLKVASAPLMHQQNRTLRAHALGNFRTLAQQIAVDPAMLRYLDNEANVVGHPQENFARELWELFLLGVGKYTQSDVVESARAWTGHGLNSSSDPANHRTTYEFFPQWHDGGAKTIFGRTGPFDGPGVIDWTLDGPHQQDVADFIVAKLWSFFVNPDLINAPLGELAETFISSNWELRPVVRALITHREFYAPRNRFALVRSPVEFAVASMRAAGLSAHDIGPDWPIIAMGQSLFDPPSVAGWPRQGGWVSAASSLAKTVWCEAVAWTASAQPRWQQVFELDTVEAINETVRLLSVDHVAEHRRRGLVEWLSTGRQHDESVTHQRLLAVAMLLPEFALS